MRYSIILLTIITIILSVIVFGYLTFADDSICESLQNIGELNCGFKERVEYLRVAPVLTIISAIGSIFIGAIGACVLLSVWWRIREKDDK